MPKISGSMLYAYVKCPHRIHMDIFANPANREPPSGFLELLWEQGNLHERDIVDDLDVSFTDLSAFDPDEKELRTLEAIERGDQLIYSPRLTHEDLVGEPDLMWRTAGGFMPGDIKSGKGTDNGKPKLHYAMQLCHYVHLFDELNLSDGTRSGIIIDRDGTESSYELNEARGPRSPQSWWLTYLDSLATVRNIVHGDNVSSAGLCADCKLCHWRSACMSALEQRDDLTLIQELGPTKRDAMLEQVTSIAELAHQSVQGLQNGKSTIFPGIGVKSLEKYIRRARLLKAENPAPYTRALLPIDVAQQYILFDIEDDPLNGLCYLHGFVHVVPETGGDRRYDAFYADEPTSASEEEAFISALNYLREKSSKIPIIFFSKHERTYWRKLAEKYPNAATVDEVNSFLDSRRAFDLYEFVSRNTEWPTYSYSIKALASYVGFSWRDSDPSGASSIGWYHEWCETNDPSVKQRILEYNEDDCIAMGKVCDAISEIKMVEE